MEKELLMTWNFCIKSKTYITYVFWL